MKLFLMFIGVGVSCRVLYFDVDHCRRLIGELIVYTCSGIRPSSVVVRPSVHNFKHLLRNRLAIQSKILVSPPRKGERKFVRGIWVTRTR